MTHTKFKMMATSVWIGREGHMRASKVLVMFFYSLSWVMDTWVFTL